MGPGLIWSRYNHLFQSARHGHLLYNALTNSFAQIAPELVGDIEAIRSDPGGFDFGRNPGLYLQLVGMKVLVEAGEERSFINILRYNDLRRRFDSRSLSLTIAPTLACNFACPYCYEENKRPVHMDAETEDRLIDFIKRFGSLRFLSIHWYGGEPFLRFERIASITERVKALGIPFTAMAVTNGYLLDERIIPRLSDLKIRTLQVTLDGDEETHDQRRFTAGGGKTYSRILANLDALMAQWDGSLVIRVNVDKSNRDQYNLVHRFLGERFKGKRVRVYPGFVEFGAGADLSCQIDRDEAALFQIQQYREHGIADLSFYPTAQAQGCIASLQNGFVIGPMGEIYRCWNDMGMPEKVVGDIRPDVAWDMAKVTDYVVGADLFDDPGCRECFFFPVCDGGCPRIRSVLHSGARDAARENGSCVQFKERLPELLEIHYEIKQQQASSGTTPC